MGTINGGDGAHHDKNNNDDADNAQQYLIDCDPLIVFKAVYHVVHNALKFTANGRVNLSVERPVPAPGTDPSVCIIVSDTGAGIPDEAIPTLFAPFYRLQPDTFFGLGLGLVITKYAVFHLMGGSIDIEHATRQGKGTAFVLTIPISFHQPKQSKKIISLNGTVNVPRTIGRGSSENIINQDGGGTSSSLIIESSARRSSATIVGGAAAKRRSSRVREGSFMAHDRVGGQVGLPLKAFNEEEQVADRQSSSGGGGGLRRQSAASNRSDIHSPSNTTTEIARVRVV